MTILSAPGTPPSARPRVPASARPRQVRADVPVIVFRSYPLNVEEMKGLDVECPAISWPEVGLWRWPATRAVANCGPFRVDSQLTPAQAAGRPGAGREGGGGWTVGMS